MEDVNVGAKKRYISYAKFLQILEVLRDFHRLFGSRNSPTTGILHTIRHVYRSVWPAREAEPHFGAALERSAHDCETRLLLCQITKDHCPAHYRTSGFMTSGGGRKRARWVTRFIGLNVLYFERSFSQRTWGTVI